MSDYFKNFICVFFLLWVSAYLLTCFLSWEMLNPISLFWDLPGTDDFREKWAGLLGLWLFASLIGGAASHDVDFFGVNDE